MAYSLNRAVDPDVGSGFAFFLGPIEGFDAVADGSAETLTGVEAADDQTLVIRLSRPAGYLPSLLTLWPYWAVDEETITANGAEWVNPPNVVGTGAYVLSEVEADAFYAFDAFDGYWGGAPSIARVEVTIVPEPATALARYEADEFDIIRNLSPEAYSQVQSDPELSEQLGTQAQLRTTWLNMRSDMAPFDDVDVRHAFNLAIDRNSLVDVALGGLAAPASTFLPPDSPAVSPKNARRSTSTSRLRRNCSPAPATRTAKSSPRRRCTTTPETTTKRSPNWFRPSWPRTSASTSRWHRRRAPPTTRCSTTASGVPRSRCTRSASTTRIRKRCTSIS